MNRPATDPAAPAPAASAAREATAATATAPPAHPLVDGPIAPALARFAWPLLLTTLLQSITGTWSVIWSSHVLGAEALTAVLTGNIFMLMTLGLVTGLGSACSVAIGQAWGRGDLQAIRRVAGTTVVFTLALSLAIAVLTFVAAPAILAAMRMPEASLAPALVYLRSLCLGMPTMFLYMVTMMMMRGVGDSRTPFRFTLLWIALALVLVPLLLTGGGVLPPLGIAGVVAGNLLANGVALAAMLATIYRNRMPIALRGADRRHFRPDPAILRMLLARGLPTAAEVLIVLGSYYALVAIVNGHGATTAAAYRGAAQVWVFVQMPATSLAQAMSAMAAINIGAGRWDRVERIASRGCALSVACAVLATGLINAFDRQVLGLFVPQGGEVLEIAREVNAHALWGWIFLSISMGYFGVVRANGGMLAPMIAFLVTMWLLRVPFAVLLQPWFGVHAIWWCFPFGSVASALIAWGWYRWGGWRGNRLLVPA